MSFILEARDIRKCFPGVKALDGVSLGARGGSVHAVVGENGAGKSTLMKILSGVYRADAGEILLDGKIVEFDSPRAAAEAGVVIIHQELNLAPALSVAENIFLGRLPARFGFVDRRKMERDAGALLDRLGHALDPRQDVSSLKVSDRQIVEIAKALSTGARALIMDEPTTALAADDVERLFAIIRTLAGAGTAVIYISHKMDELFRIADEFTVLRDGKLIGRRAASETTPGELARMMVGREISYERVGERSQSDARSNVELLRVESLSSPEAGVGRTTRLSDISFNLRAGEVLGVAGLMGAGRTELLESLFGWRRTTGESRVEMGGQPLAVNDPRQAIRAGLAFVSEDRKAQGLALDLDVGGNITLARLKRFSRFGFIQAAREEEAAREFIARLGINTPDTRAAAANLSGGNQQKIVLAKWLLTDPKILLLDEPTKGIDIKGKAEIYRLIEELAARGLGFILVSSELPELLALSDRIIVLREGRLAGALDRSEATEERIIELATLRNEEGENEMARGAS
ncbi:MAG TPA: sugar ABC transporter ATP-binding protein [Blastocatellia bacterium]|jgi:ribose transport system ATP-binding protein|nr:sugar ABC transporter ATP-binding protein [Blastocatellia bacterium]